MNDNTTVDKQLILLKTRHSETLGNWTGSLDDPVFDYLNIPLFKVTTTTAQRFNKHAKRWDRL